jgi:hypothetical protein
MRPVAAAERAFLENLFAIGKMPPEREALDSVKHRRDDEPCTTG